MIEELYYNLRWVLGFLANMQFVVACIGKGVNPDTVLVCGLLSIMANGYLLQTSNWFKAKKL